MMLWFWGFYSYVAYNKLHTTTCQENNLTQSTFLNKKNAMITPVSIRMDPKMKKALEKLAKKEFTSVASLLKKGAEKVLEENGIDWRQESDSS